MEFKPQSIERRFTFHFAVMAGSPSADEIVRPFLWGIRGLADTLKSHIRPSYGEALQRISFRLYVEGHHPMDIPARAVLPYRKKDRELLVTVPLSKSFLDEVTSAKMLDEIQRCLLWVIEAVAELPITEFDLAGLRADVQRALDAYSKSWRDVEISGITRQLLIMRIPLSMLPPARVVGLENEFLDVLGQKEELDGHEIASKWVDIFVLTKDPAATLTAIMPILGRHDLARDVKASSRFLGVHGAPTLLTH